MVKKYAEGGIYHQGTLYLDGDMPADINKDQAKTGTMAYDILKAHNTSGSMEELEIKFDAMASHDITYVGIIQTARASGLEKFPLPYVLTNCHNSLCAVGGTINEDDHVFGLSAAKKYGGDYVPAHQAVIHSYMREMYAGCGKMILGSDSHTRYGALGTMAIGEGGPELVKQLLEQTYDVDYPDIVGVYLTGKPHPGVGPQDVALALIGEVFESGFVKNRVLEFFGPGVNALSIDYRFGIDVMTTETTCLSSIWSTDDQVKDYLNLHGRGDEYKPLAPKETAYYDRVVTIDLAKVKPMIALPFHPSNVYTIEEVVNHPKAIFEQVEANAKQVFGEAVDFHLTDKIIDGQVQVEQGIIAGCSGGTYENIHIAGKMMAGQSTGDDEFILSVYPGSQPIFHQLTKDGSIASLMETGANIKTAFCGPCFGAGDVPANNALSIRHTTRNFPNREGSKPSDGQIASVALMDARSIAATAINKGRLTPATEILTEEMNVAPYAYAPKIYDNRIYHGALNPQPEVELKYGPNIKDWPKMITMPKHLLLEVASVITDPVTTTDELIPSGETSSYRSNPLRLAEFALSRKDPSYVPKAKEVHALEKARRQGKEEARDYLNQYQEVVGDISLDQVSFGSLIYATKPGDGSAREQAASVQKVLGGWGNIATDYATKRYRSNCVNWGLLPFITDQAMEDLSVGDVIFIKDILQVMESDQETVNVVVIKETGHEEKTLRLPHLTKKERAVLKEGCLMNYYKKTL